ncbi:MAG: tetratricopeptide repeat protein [Humidesulfovibrio sp.]|nr:tetratricopeptide repeat protein [Humidesulfovibrio sp.]
MTRLLALYIEGRFAEAAVSAQELTTRFPSDGFGWKVMGALYQQMGQRMEALAANRKAAALLPQDAEAHYNFGVSLQGLGLLEEAEASYRRALEITPEYAEAQGNLGNILGALGRLAEAEACYRKALSAKPDYVEARNNLGVLLSTLGRLGEAEANYRQALLIRPDYAEAQNNLGNALKEQGRLAEAEASYRQALAIRPGYAEAQSNLGVTLHGLGRLAEAEASHRQALGFQPGCAEVQNNLGNTLMALGRQEEAENRYRQALAINPGFPEAHGNLGIALKGRGRLDEAKSCFLRSLELKPASAEVHSNLGALLKEQGQLEAAEACCRRALKIAPGFAEAQNNLGAVLKESGRLGAAETCFRRTLELAPDNAEALSNLLFTLHYSPSHDHASRQKEANRYGKLAAARVRKRFASWGCKPGPERLRVGLVSGDLRNHAVGFFLESVLEQIDQSRIELIAYPTGGKEDGWTARVKPRFSAWKPLTGLSDEAAARLIHADNVHLLLDLSGHTAKNRLPVFAWKPAPVQATWLGYFATTGLAEMDYLIADPFALRESEAECFTEMIYRLPETRFCFSPPEASVEVSPLPALANGFVTFGCFNDLAKMNDEVVALWAKVLAAVPRSRLFLKAGQLGEPALRRNTLGRFAAHGIEAERLILEGPESREKYLKAYHRVDVALDPFPYPGGVTTIEGLWMGVPLVTMAGTSLLSRQGVGILMNAGLPEWIAPDPASYVELAAAHGNDLGRLSGLRSKLRKQVLASPLFDAPRFARHLETALWWMWRAGCARQT